jgi:D-apionolactonase
MASSSDGERPGMTILERWYGRDEPPQELRWLRAGDLLVALDGADMRYVRLGELELVRRVYVAVRDLNWDTIGDVERETSVEEHERSFVVRSRVRHSRGPIDFVWDGVIEGRENGTISYAVDGRCQSSFQYAKIGICVHHPSRECAGRPYAATTPDGVRRGTLPLAIGPQIFDREKGYELPLVDPFSALSIELEDGPSLGFAFEGQLFEMEDQRNWTDASFKTASTPAYLGFMHQAERGRKISQRVRIVAPAPERGIGVSVRPRSPRARALPTLHVGDALGRPLPPIGFGLPGDGSAHTEREAERVRELRPAHLRADVHADDAPALDRALAECVRLGTQAELALHVDPERLDAVAAVSDALHSALLARVLVFEDGAPCTPRATVDAVRRWVRPDVPLVGGTNIYFCDINRDRPDVAGLGGIAYSINSQVHAFDELSLVEAVAAHADTVVSARALFPGVPIVVSPVTLRPRFNPVAVAQEFAPDEPELPWQVDPRQMSEFGAVWTLGSVAALCSSGAASLTYYETAGWRGLFERDAGNPQPALFKSSAGMLFPFDALFGLLRDARDAELLMVAVDEPLSTTGLAYRRGEEVKVIIGNLTHEPLRVSLTPGSRTVDLRPYGIELVRV